MCGVGTLGVGGFLAFRPGAETGQDGDVGGGQFGHCSVVNDDVPGLSYCHRSQSTAQVCWNSHKPYEGILAQNSRAAPSLSLSILAIVFPSRDTPASAWETSSAPHIWAHSCNAPDRVDSEGLIRYGICRSAGAGAIFKPGRWDWWSCRGTQRHHHHTRIRSKLHVDNRAAEDRTFRPVYIPPSEVPKGCRMTHLVDMYHCDPLPIAAQRR